MSRYLQIAILILTLVAAIWFAATRPRGRNRLLVKAYFENVQGLRAGAPVRLAGVDVGHVIDVRARPESREYPAEVIMNLQTSYELKIPNDAIVSVDQAGVLGEPFVDINIKSAFGPPLESGGTLKTGPGRKPMSEEEFLKCISDIAQHKPCDMLTGNKESKEATPGEASDKKR
ncbi:MAG TPA: MlaD family protein [Verrucomicrobiae bacterium]|nr:MlaD family protein [Verrucomicrobiae bacterium]